MAGIDVVSAVHTNNSTQSHTHSHIHHVTIIHCGLLYMYMYMSQSCVVVSRTLSKHLTNTNC